MTIRFLFTLVVVTLVACKLDSDLEVYRAALEDNKILRLLFEEGITTKGPHSTLQESRLRLKLFRRSVQDVVHINSRHLPYKTDINFMSYLSDEERLQYTGFNVSDVPALQNKVEESSEEEKEEVDWEEEKEEVDWVKVEESSEEEKEEVDWVSAGYVTYVQDQGMCGSCWTFAGVGPVEGRYALTTATLHKYSEQEALECVYDKDEKDGCRGGQYFHQWDWVKRVQHQSLARDYKYKGVIYSCRSSWFKNHLTEARLTGFVRPQPNYRALAAALNTGPLAVGIKVSKELYLYKSGVFTKEDCGTPANHAVVAVGYTSQYFKLKNSWGEKWGDNGFVKFSRAVDNMCDISLWAAYPTMEKIDAAPHSDACVDKRQDCQELQQHCGNGELWKIMATGCAKTCRTCGCRNAMPDCAEWASEEFCSKPNYAEYMGLYCPLSCGTCEIHPTFAEEKACTDTSDKCVYYSSSGYCTKYPEFVSTRCRKTCQLCNDEGSCEDRGLVLCHGECRHQHLC